MKSYLTSRVWNDKWSDDVDKYAVINTQTYTATPWQYAAQLDREDTIKDSLVKPPPNWALLFIVSLRFEAKTNVRI